MQVKVTRLITNQIIIGKTTNEGDIFIEDPYEIVPGEDGLKMIPMDKYILGVTLGSITIYHNNAIYSQEPDEALRNTYLETISGIELPEQKIII